MNDPANHTHRDAATSHLPSSSAPLQLTLTAPDTEGSYKAEDPYRRIAQALRRGRWIALGTFLLVFVSVAAFTFTREPVYQATSLVYVDPKPSAPQLDGLLDFGEVSRNIKNEVEIITSRSLALEVAERLLRQARGAAPPSLTILRPREDGPLTAAEVARRLREDYVSVTPAGTDVDVIRISAMSPVPEEAQYIAEAYAEVYSDYNRSSSRSAVTASREFFDEVTGRFSEQLQETEDELTAFLNQERIVEPDEEARQLLEQVGQLQSLQYQTRLALGKAEAELRGLEQEVERITPGIAARIASNDDILVDRVKEQIAALQIEQQQIYARYPNSRTQRSEDGRLAEIERELENLTRQLDQRVGRLVASATDADALGSAAGGEASGVTASQLQAVQGLRHQITEKDIEISGLQARLDIVDDELNQFQNRLAEIPDKALVLERLQRARQSQEAIYLALVERMQEARVAEQSEFGYVKVIDEAYVPEEPVRPRKALNLALGGLMGLLFGVALAFAWSKVDVKVRTPEDLEGRGLHVLGIVPSLARLPASGGATPELFIALDSYSPLSEEYRRIHTNLRFTQPDRELAVVLITSAAPQEGKSVTAVNLAATIAQSGRSTLLIDGDLHVAAVTGVLGASAEPGLVDLLFEPGPVSPGLYTRPTDVRGLHLLPAGKEVHNPGAVLNSEKMRELLTALRADFETVVIDSPPVLGVADPLLLAAQCDAVVVTAYAGRTDTRELEQTVKAVQNAGGEIYGAVLNGLDGSATYSSYGYRHGYRVRYPRAARRSGGARESVRDGGVAVSEPPTSGGA